MSSNGYEENIMFYTLGKGLRTVLLGWLLLLGFHGMGHA